MRLEWKISWEISGTSYPKTFLVFAELVRDLAKLAKDRDAEKLLRAKLLLRICDRPYLCAHICLVAR